MFGKLIDGQLQYAQKNYDSEDGLIVNFNTNEDVMKKYGFKPVTNVQPDYDLELEYLSVSGYTEEEDFIVVNYEIKEKNIDIDELKEKRVKESKEQLAKYLLEHPLLSTVKHEEGKLYACTSEKQQQLTSKLLIATMYQQLGKEYQLSWNDTGDVCEYDWTIEQLTQLSLQIDGYVTPLVSKQQHIEVDIRNCETVEDVLAVEIKYGE